jgi:hypothetical protein
MINNSKEKSLEKLESVRPPTKFVGFHAHSGFS